jgi:ABC-type sugar transport system ATPase subunit
MSAGTQDNTLVLRIDGVSKTFGAVEALRSVRLGVYSHEIHALVGDNGAGKSTLIKIMSGVLEADGGVLEVNGVAVHFTSPLDARRAGVETVYQDLALAESLEASDNVYLGREITMPGFLGRLGFLDRETMRRNTSDRLAEFGIVLPSARQECESLSGGQKQAVAVARAAMWGRRVLLMDEPTAALGVTQREMVHRLIRTTREQGLAVVLISHNILEIFELADRVTVLRLGEVVLSSPISETTPELVVGAMSGIARAAGSGSG